MKINNPNPIHPTRNDYKNHNNEYDSNYRYRPNNSKIAARGGFVTNPSVSGVRSLEEIGQVDILKKSKSSKHSPPSLSPAPSISQMPTSFPSTSPSVHPTGFPTSSPSYQPSISHKPSDVPSDRPSLYPSVFPSYVPSNVPSLSHMPSVAPTSRPTSMPTGSPTSAPTSAPSLSPTTYPTVAPTLIPTSFPSFNPTDHPTFSSEPTNLPTFHLVTIPNQPTVTICNIYVDEYEDGGEENGLLVGFDYTLEYDSSTNGADNLIGSLETAISSDVSNELLDCSISASNRRRRLNSNRRLQVRGVNSLPTDIILKDDSCESAVSSASCIVVAGSMTIYHEKSTPGDEMAQIQTLLEERMSSGVYNDVHPDIVDVKYRNRRTDVLGASGNDGLGTSASNSNIFDFSGDNLIGAFVLGGLSAAFISIVVLAAKVRRKRRREELDQSNRQAQNWFNMDEPDSALPVNAMHTKDLSYDTSDIRTDMMNNGNYESDSYSSSTKRNDFHMGDDADSDGWEKAEVQITPPTTPNRSKPHTCTHSSEDSIYNKNSGIEVDLKSREKLGFPIERSNSLASKRSQRGISDTVYM